MTTPTTVQLSPTRAAPPRPLRVALVTMPFASLMRPSIQLGLLAGYGRRHGHHVDTLHLNLELGARLGVERYNRLAEQRSDVFVGDWLFAEAAFGDEAPPVTDEQRQRLLGAVGSSPTDDDAVEELLALRAGEIPAYLDHLAHLVAWGDYDLVGFSSTFQQNNASFALARRLKEHHPELLTIFGGANFEGGMGRALVAAIPQIDLAVSGEADDAFPAVLRALASGDDPATVPGVLVRRDGGVAGTPPAEPFAGLDDQPDLDYDDYFARAERLGLLDPVARRDIDLPFESARGCWWGAKRHCTFCGLNGGTMAFRSKSPSRVLAELTSLVRRYRSFRIEAVDNIVDTAYLGTVFPALEALGTDLELFYEVKADLSRDDLRRMHRAGVRRIQPGIESLNSHVLALMRKGTRAVWNVNVLRWSRYYGIEVGWNLLYGFPGETEEDYADTERLLPNLVHLEPPTGPGRIWMERFSPLFTERDTFPAASIAPSAGYRDIYPARFDLDACAYFFDYQLDNTLDQATYAGCHKEIGEWQEAWRSDTVPELVVWRMPGFIQIEDRRRPDTPGTYTFEGPMADLYLATMDQALRPAEILRNLGWPTDEANVTGLLDELCEAGLTMRDRNLYLSLAIPAIRKG